MYIFVYFIHYTFLFVLCTICFDWPEEKAIQNFNLHVYNDNKGVFYSILFYSRCFKNCTKVKYLGSGAVGEVDTVTH